MSDWLTATIPSRPLGLARILIGAAAAIRAAIAWPVLMKLADEGTLKAPYFDWYPEPVAPLVVVLVVVWFLSAVLFALGVRATWSGLVLFGCLVFTLALDQQAYANHLYLMTWLVLLLVLADAGAGLGLRRPDRPAVRWPVFLLKCQVSIVYGFAALTKLNEEFLSGQVISGFVHGGLVDFPDLFRTEAVFVALSVGTVFVELFLAAFLWVRRFRPAAFAFGVLLHTPIVLLIPATGELLVFAVELLALYPLFLSTEKVKVIWDDDCGSCRDWITRFKRFDVLQLLDPIGKSEGTEIVDPTEVERSLHVVHDRVLTRGFAAIIRILEHLVPTLWVAPFLRLPGVSRLGELWYRWQARRRSCRVGYPDS